MPVFESRQQFEGVMEALFREITATPAILEALTATCMILRFRYTEPTAVLTFDFTTRPPALRTDDEGDAHLEMAQSADVSHQFWLGRLSVVKALATGKVRAKGDVSKALSLLPAIRPAFDLYPRVLRKLDLGHLVPAEAPPRRRRWLARLRRALAFRGRPRVDLAALPVDAVPPSASAPREASVSAPRPLLEATRGSQVAMLRRMLLIREFEETLSRHWNAGEIPTSAIHLSIGQEGVAVGVCSALRPDDCIATTHRGHGHMLAKGAPADLMMAEIYGKAGGLCGGKGGSMHVTDARIGAIGANGIVGSSPLLAMGAALSFSHHGSDRVAVAFLGDGATNQGMFHEAVNLAAVWDLPVLFVIENNGYGEFTAQAKTTRLESLADRAAAYGVPGLSIDGNDVEAVAETSRRLVGELRSGSGPALLECRTYRWHGHMEGDREPYRTEEEKATWKTRCPIARWSHRLVENRVMTRGEIDALREEVREEIERARRFAEQSAEPAPETLSVEVFAPEPSPESSAPDAPAPGAARAMTGAAAINLALREEMERDPDVILLGEDVSYGGYMAVTTGLVDRFGRDRIRDTPISEYAIVGGAVGAAMTGLRPVAEILFADFLTTCMDPLVNQAAKLRYMSGGQYKIPLTLRTPCGTGLGMAAQHSQSFESLLMGIPGLLIAAPSSARDCRALLKTAVRSDNPVLFFEHKLLYLTEGEVPDEEDLLPFGRAAVVREGADVTVVALLYMVQQAMEAAELLAREGIEVEVVDLRTLVPLDTETILRSVARTRRLVTVEEAPVRHGWGAEVLARVATAAHGLLKAPPRRIGGTDNPIPYNKRLENLSVPDAEGIAEAIRQAMGR
jgi:2-oxoisovalerate dehydrogenase E1 component